MYFHVTVVVVVSDTIDFDRLSIITVYLQNDNNVCTKQIITI